MSSTIAFDDGSSAAVSVPPECVVEGVVAAGVLVVGVGVIVLLVSFAFLLIVADLVNPVHIIQ